MKYNDNELLYLISETDEIAFEFIVKKYEPLIKSRLVNFKINVRSFEDYFQECLMTLNKCIMKYRDDKEISFNKYFDKMLQYRIKHILESEKDYYYNVINVDEIELDKLVITAAKDEFVESDVMLSKYEKKVFELLKENKSIEIISSSLNKNVESVYNTIARVKRKLRNNKLSDNKLSDNKLSDNKLSDNCNLVYNKSHEELSFLEREVYLRYIQGYKAREISYMMRIEIDKVYNALRRIKKKLKKN